MISDSDVEDQRSNLEARSQEVGFYKLSKQWGKQDSNNLKLFKQLIDNFSSIIESKLHARDFDKPWESSYDGIIYVGDSVHLVRPTTSKGTALMFGDETGLETVISKSVRPERKGYGICITFGYKN